MKRPHPACSLRKASLRPPAPRLTARKPFAQLKPSLVGCRDLIGVHGKVLQPQTRQIGEPGRWKGECAGDAFFSGACNPLHDKWHGLADVERSATRSAILDLIVSPPDLGRPSAAAPSSCQRIPPLLDEREFPENRNPVPTCRGRGRRRRGRSPPTYKQPSDLPLFLRNRHRSSNPQATSGWPASSRVYEHRPASFRKARAIKHPPQPRVHLAWRLVPAPNADYTDNDGAQPKR